MSGADTADLARRLERARDGATGARLDSLLVTPGPDLRYLVGYDAVPLERLTCLVVRPGADPVLVVPLLERPAAEASPAGALGIGIRTWTETDDPYALVAELVPAGGTVGVDDHMWAAKVLGLRDAMPGARQVLAGGVLHALRMRKSQAEIDALQRAADAIDRVHAQVAGLLRPGRSEREVGRDIADLILAEGHVTADFVIVASGPNGASPHHEVSDRILQQGDAVVVDIGGTMPDGYCSDETRTYSLGDPGARYREHYAALQESQASATAGVRPGVPCEAIDGIARRHLEDAGLGEYFIHRTGHGIGLETHEDPYIVTGNRLPLEPGMAFSIEPGFYIPGEFGARIEDIVVCGDEGPIVLNRRPHDLVVVPA
ncbi:MAG: M24 family metallopeptidase [Candidatus Nanopelagicales bacterium]